jgi:hypothetical protein
MNLWWDTRVSTEQQHLTAQRNGLHALCGAAQAWRVPARLAALPGVRRRTRPDRRMGERSRKPCEDGGSESPAKPGNCLQGSEPFREILWSCAQRRTKCSHLWKTGLVASSGPADNSVSKDSDRFLAVGAVTQSDRLVVELVQRPDTPDAILIKWPPQPTITDPAKLTATIASIVRVLGTAQIELAAPRGWAVAPEHSKAPPEMETAVCTRSPLAA